MRCTFDKDIITARLHELSVDGIMPTASYFDANRGELCCTDSIKKKWRKNWTAIASEIGLTPACHSKWSNSDISEAMQALSTNGEMPTRSRWNRRRPQGAPNATTCERRFGSWAALSEMCDLRYEPTQYERKAEPLNLPQQSKIFAPKQRPEPTFENPSYFQETHVPMVGVRA